MCRHLLTHWNRILPTIEILLLLSLVSILISCSQVELTNPPYVPARYYDCLEVKPDQLHDIYYSSYGNVSIAKAMYNNKRFVFKNILVEEWMLKHIDEGWIWVSQIRCDLGDQCDRSYLTLGNEVDVVGLNMGPDESNLLPGLQFEDCIVIPAGSVTLPADANIVTIVPGY